MVNSTLSKETKQRGRRRSAKPQQESAAATPTSTKPSVSSCDDLKILIAKRAYELYSERGYRHGFAFDDWLEAEREILSQVPP
jgi:hypothetical protein